MQIFSQISKIAKTLSNLKNQKEAEIFMNFALTFWQELKQEKDKFEIWPDRKSNFVDIPSVTSAEIHSYQYNAGQREERFLSKS